MNILSTCSKLSQRIPNLVNNLSGRYVTRNVSEFRKLAQHGIVWERPKKLEPTCPEKTGDLGLDIKVNPSDYCYSYEKSKHLSNADENIKKLFTLQFNKQSETNLLQKHKLLNEIKRHNFDDHSVEVKIANLTLRIKRLQHVLDECPKNNKIRINLKAIIYVRRKLLSYLRNTDYRRFEWLLEKLNLEFKPKPVNDVEPQRKLSLRKLVEKKCNKIIQKKLDDCKAEFESQKIDFYKEKAEQLARIRQEEIELGLTSTVSEEEVARAQEQMALYSNK